MEIAVKDRWAVMVKDDTLIQNSEKTYTVKFTFDESWNGAEKTVIFEAGCISVPCALTEDRCTIPPECLKQGGVTLKIGVMGGEQKAVIWCNASRILYAIGMNLGQVSTPSSGECVCDVATDEEVDAVINDVFGEEP